MRESESCRMKELAAERGHARFADTEVRGSSIQCISNQRMLQRGEVHSNLMRPSGMQLDLEQRRGAEFQQLPPIRQSFTRRGRQVFSSLPCRSSHCFHPRAANRVAANREADSSAALFEFAFGEGDVGLLHGPRAE